MTTLANVLSVAATHWADREGGSVQLSRLKACVGHLGVSTSTKTLGPSSGVSLLEFLRTSRGLSPKSVQDYYGTFLRALALSGVSTATWPKAPTPPRVKAREPMKAHDVQSLIDWLGREGYGPTADLARFIRATGLRINVEALSKDHLEVLPMEDGAGFVPLRIKGKGGHERVIPVVDPEGIALLTERFGDLEAVREVSYGRHLRAWNQGVKALGINSRLATPHSVRHSYACDALKLSGGNLSLVQELLGHSSPATTAKYLQTDLGAKAKALSTTGTTQRTRLHEA